MVNYAEALDRNAGARKQPKSKLEALDVSEAENGGHIVVHRMNPYNGPDPKHSFGKPQGRVKLPKGHVLQHIAEHMNIPHTVDGSGSDGE